MCRNGRRFTPSAARIRAYWAKEWPSFVDDADDASCFACHIFQDDDGWPRLQRCHIVAHSVDGSSEPSNFLILCEDCHRAAPMTSDRTILLQWVHERPSWSQLFAEMALEGLRRAGIESTNIRLFTQQEFHDFLRAKHIDFHPNATRQDKMTCIAYLLREFLDTIQKEVQLNVATADLL